MYEPQFYQGIIELGKFQYSIFFNGYIRVKILFNHFSLCIYIRQQYPIYRIYRFQPKNWSKVTNFEAKNDTKIIVFTIFIINNIPTVLNNLIEKNRSINRTEIDFDGDFFKQEI